jgi:hypothetical protein
MFTIIKITGRTPPCENCSKRKSEVQVDGISALAKLKLCRPCYETLSEAISDFVWRWS